MIKHPHTDAVRALRKSVELPPFVHVKKGGAVNWPMFWMMLAGLIWAVTILGFIAVMTGAV